MTCFSEKVSIHRKIFCINKNAILSYLNMNDLKLPLILGGFRQMYLGI